MHEHTNRCAHCSHTDTKINISDCSLFTRSSIKEQFQEISQTFGVMEWKMFFSVCHKMYGTDESWETFMSSQIEKEYVDIYWFYFYFLFFSWWKRLYTFLSQEPSHADRHLWQNLQSRLVDCKMVHLKSETIRNT